ncbi:GMC family oxidoreductase N-terminal domain-containing protein [Endothiovibrio diazotrophicus]
MKKEISRRNFIKALGLGVGGLALCRSPAVLSALAADSEPVDVMVIGSGFGGAVTALRLAEQGVTTVMLERGRRWPVTAEQNTFSSLQNPDGRSAWLSDSAILGEPKPIDRYIGILDLTIGDGIASLAGAGVGGGSLVYAGALYQPTPQMFAQTFGDSLDYGPMDEVYYPRVRSLIRPSPMPRSILARRDYAAARTWLQLGQRAGLTSRLLDLGLSWDIVHKELRGQRVESVIAGEFWYGNNSGAKRSLDTNYLHRAERTGHLDLQTQQNVTSIATGPDGRYVVSADELDSNGGVLRRRTYVVRRLFLAAGSVATSRLLVRARGRGDLPELNAEVGQNWGNNGDMFSQISGLRSRIKPNRGGPVTVAIEDHANALAPVSVESYADWSTEGEQGLVASIGMSTPPALGRFTYDPAADDVLLYWPAGAPATENVIAAGQDTYERLALAWGMSRRDVRAVRHGHVEMREGSSQRRGRGAAGSAPVEGGVTAHPLGGVVLDRATDNIGTVCNYPGLYVMDGALMPGHTGCTNPALTIAAMAERNIEQILARDFS